MSSIKLPIQKNVAFVVGIANYENDMPTLKTPINDVDLVASALHIQGFEVVMETDATDKSLRGLLKRIKKEYQTENIRLVVYSPVQSVEQVDANELNRDLVPPDASVDAIKLAQREDRIQTLQKQLDEAEKQMRSAEQAKSESDNQRTAALLQQSYAEKQRNRSKKRTKKAVFFARLAIGIGLIVLTVGIMAVVKNMEVTKQKKITEYKAIEAKRQLRNALISERSKLNDSLKILVQEIEVFGKAQEYDFVENRYAQFNNTWKSIENLTANIRDSIQLNDNFLDNFKWSVSPDAAYNRRQVALKSFK